jgi:hypothetical protein
VIEADVTHRRSGDGQIEVSSFAVRLEENVGDPLSAWQATALLDAVAIYWDDGDGDFEPGVDGLLASVSPAGIDFAGVVWVDVADGLARARCSPRPKTYFVVRDTGPIGDLADTIRITLLTDGDAVCEAETAATTSRC